MRMIMLNGEFELEVYWKMKELPKYGQKEQMYM